MKTKIYYYIPENLDLEKLLIKYPPDFKFNIHKAHLFLSKLKELTNSGKFVTRNGFLQMSSKMIQNLSIRDFPKYRNWLIKAGIILFDDTYISMSLGAVPLCMRYRFTDEYHLSKVKLIPVTYWSHYKKISFRLKSLIEKNINRLNKAFFNKNLRIDIQLLEVDLKLEYLEEVSKGVAKEKALRKHDTSLINAVKINQGNFYLTVDKTIGRHHSNIVELSKIARYHLTYKGESLIELDFSNAQLLFFSILLTPKFWKINEFEMFASLLDSNEIIKQDSFRYSRLCFKHSSDVKMCFNTPSLYMLAENLQDHSIREFKRFVYLVEKGEIYEYLHHKFSLSSTKYNLQTKSEFKKSFITFINSRIDYKSEFYKLFKKEFKVITNLLIELKKGDYRALSHLLLYLETKVMYERIIPTIKHQRPDIVFYTVHDCILCTESNIDFVRNVMIEQTQIAFGVTPTIR